MNESPWIYLCTTEYFEQSLLLAIPKTSAHEVPEMYPPPTFPCSKNTKTTKVLSAGSASSSAVTVNTHLLHKTG